MRLLIGLIGALLLSSNLAAELRVVTAEVIWRSTDPRLASTERWVCGDGDQTIEFRFYPDLTQHEEHQWIVHAGPMYEFARRQVNGFEAYFYLLGSTHQIHIRADGTALYFPFSETQDDVESSAKWPGCRRTL